MKFVFRVIFCTSLLINMTYATDRSLAESTPPDSGQEIQDVNNKIQAQLKALQAQQQDQIATLNTQVQTQLKEMQAELQKQIQTVNSQTQTQMKEIQTTLQHQIAQVQQQIKH
jgi:TolA-binding protein